MRQKLVSCLLGLFWLVQLGVAINPYLVEYRFSKYLNWIKQFNANFENYEEFMKRLEIFSKNDDLIEQHNSGENSYKMGHNQFSHLTFDEFRNQVGLNQRIPHAFQTTKTGMHPLHQVSASVPDSVDWVTSGAVTGVKDQGSCGSCWSFSTTGCMEGAYYLKTGSLQSFSEQQLVSCDTIDSGCNGGLMDYAFEWIQSNGGICLEDDYPYASDSGKAPRCDTTCTIVEGTTPKSWTDIYQTEAALMSALAQQPVSVAIEADQTAFQFYNSGVLTGHCGTNLDHGVLAVGYGTDNGTDYWKVKNSWGDTWGETGYIRLERGIDQVGGQCGILLAASYVTL